MSRESKSKLEQQIEEQNLIKIKVDDLKFDKTNPNKLTQEQMTGLRRSMTRFGYLTPIIIDQNNQIADGEHRALVYKEYGIKEIPAFKLNLKDDSERRMLRQIMNKLHGEHDRQLDADELVQIFKAGKLDDLSQLIAQETEDLQRAMLRYHPSLDFVTPENQDEIDRLIDDELKRLVPDTQLGDLYQLGNHRLICADSTDIRSIVNLLGDEKADICFTSPPYNAACCNVRGTRHVKVYGAYTDNLSTAEYSQFLRTSLETMLQYCHECYYNIALIASTKISVIEILHIFKEQFKDLFYWVKEDLGTPDNFPGHLQNAVELILIFSREDNKKAIRHYTFSVAKMPLRNVIEGKKVNVRDNPFSSEHRAVFPVYLPYHIISTCTHSGDTILEPFAGTGTTMIAAEQLNRQCYGIEIDPHYCDIIVKRWEAYTNKKAIKIEK